MDGLTTGYNTLTEEMFGTPTPQTNGPFVFGEPTNAPWSAIQDALVGGEIMLIALLLLVMSVQGRHTIQIFNIGSAYEARKTKKTAWVGAFLIIVWYWVGVLSLYIVDGFSIALMPGMASLRNAMLGFLSVTLTNPGLSLLFALIGGISMWALRLCFTSVRFSSTYISTECRLRLLSDMEISPLCLILRWDSVGGLSPCRPSAASRDSVQRI